MARKKIKCKECGKSFVSKYHLEIHNKVHANESDQENSNAVKVAMKNAETQSCAIPYQCQSCSSVSCPKESLHTYQKSQCCTHPCCSQSSNSGDTYNAHSATPRVVDQAEKKQHPTSSIPNTSSNSQMQDGKNQPSVVGNTVVLNLHLNLSDLVNSSEKMLNRTSCRESFPSNASSEKHVKQHTSKPSSSNTHLNELKVTARFYSCHFCEKKFFSPSTLALHVESHTKQLQQSYQHDISHAPSQTISNFISRNTLPESDGRTTVINDIPSNASMQLPKQLGSNQLLHLHQQKFIKCQFCNRVFFCENLYRSHLKLHTETKPAVASTSSTDQANVQGVSESTPAPFKCEFCHQLYPTSRSLGEHVRHHSDYSRLHQCKDCGKKFAFKQDFLCHQKTHNKEVEAAPKASADDLNASADVSEVKNSMNTKTRRSLKLAKAKPSSKRSPKAAKVASSVTARRKSFLQTVTTKPLKSGALKSSLKSTIKSSLRARSKKTAKRVSFKINSAASKKEKKKKAAIVFICDVCQDILPDKKSLESHKAAKHSSDKPYKCDLCSNMFPKARFLACHKRMVHKV